jgi:1,4-dihydroxy-2-naphthoate octaprenyltransferase
VAGLIYALGVTGVILGKHIDKREADEEKGIHTLPVLIGERASRYLTTAMLVLQYVAVAYLVLVRTFHPVVLVTFLALPSLVRIWRILRQPRPAEKPADFPDVWPNYYVAAAFYHNRSFGMLYLVGLVAQTIVRMVTR